MNRTIATGARILTTAVLLAAGVQLAARREAPPQRALREKQVFVSALDRGGKRVSDLAAGDLAIREDDVAREVLRVEPAAGPMQVVLLADTSDATQALIPDLRKGLASLVTAILTTRSDSQVELMTFGERPTRDVSLTTSEVTLQRAVARVFSRPGGGSYLLEAITEAVKDLKKVQATRPVIVVFSDLQSPEFSTQSHQQIADVLKDSNASLWAIVFQTRGTSVDSDAERNRAAVLGDMTTASGGTNESILARTALEPKFAELAQRLTSQYVVTYSRPESLIPPSRLEITVKREGLRLLAPRWTGQ